jgi:phage/plasmid primase-like uncharacterized protein
MPIMAAIQGLGLTLKRVTATDLAGPCPRCGGDDRFRLNMKTGAHHCRQCGAKGGDSIELIRLARGLQFREAVEDINGESEVERPAPAPIVAKPKPVGDTKLAEFILKVAAKSVRAMVPILGTPGEA